MTRIELKNLRERYGYGIRTVAKEMGVSHSYLQQLENGTKRITPELMQQTMQAIYRLQQKGAAKE